MNKKVLIIAIISLALDQLSKFLIDYYLKIGDTIKVIKSFFYLMRIGNTGAAFSILEGETILLIVASFISIFMIFKYIKEFKKTWLSSISFGIILGGIVGNLIDRIFFGFVRDFLKFNIFGYNFPVFNIADACIVIGVIILIICMFRGDDLGAISSTKSRKSIKA